MAVKRRIGYGVAVAAAIAVLPGHPVASADDDTSTPDPTVMDVLDSVLAQPGVPGPTSPTLPVAPPAADDSGA